MQGSSHSYIEVYAVFSAGLPPSAAHLGPGHMTMSNAVSISHLHSSRILADLRQLLASL